MGGLVGWVQKLMGGLVGGVVGSLVGSFVGSFVGGSAITLAGGAAEHHKVRTLHLEGFGRKGAPNKTPRPPQPWP